MDEGWRMIEDDGDTDEFGSKKSSGHRMLEEDEADQQHQFLPDWQLIDEISIKLLEQGVGTFETLQRALPSVVLAQIDQILPVPSGDGNISDPDSSASRCCSAVRLLKLFRLAQLQIDYLLKTQQGIVQRLDRAERRAGELRKENRMLRRELLNDGEGEDEGRRGGGGGGGGTSRNGSENERDQQEEEEREGGGKQRQHAKWGRELFRCNECSKLFLHVNFLADHIARKHSGQIENAARGKGSSTKVSRGGKAERVLGMEDEEEEQDTVKGAKSIQPGYSQESGGTLRKRTDVRSATGTFAPSSHRQNQKCRELCAQKRQSGEQVANTRPGSSENIHWEWK